MNRALTFLAGPELVLAALTVGVFAFCARHNSYGSADVRVLERLLLLLPFVVVPAGFLTILAPEAKSWTWLTRANLAILVCIAVCGYRIVSGFGAPGSGPKGQDAGMILVVSFAICLATVANAICGAMVLRAQSPGVAEWFRLHPIGGHALTAAATVPIFAVLVLAAVLLVTVLASVAGAFQR